MSLRVLVAGATGVIGTALLPSLRERGHHVTALLRQANGARAGAERRSWRELNGTSETPSVQADDIVVADIMDARQLRQVLRNAAPEVVIHQVSGFRDPDVPTALQRTARLWDAGTRNLVNAAVAAGARRVIAQSAASAYRPHGHDVLDEEAPLWTEAPGRWGEFVRAVSAMEESVLTCPDIEGIALRYGALYGPGTWYAPGGVIHDQVRGSALPLIDDGIGLTSFTHLEDASSAVLEVLTGGDPGSYNVVDNEPAESGEWLPAYARMVGGPAPVSLTLEQAKTQLDWFTVHQLTEQRGATNFRIRETLGWRPAWPSWREGFAALFGAWPR